MPQKSSRKHKKLKGFTVPELLTIIAVVGILAIIAFTAYAPSKARTRDSKRVVELNHLRTALQLYHMDNGRYPDSIPSEEWCSLEDSCANVLAELSPYLPSTPTDPLFGKGKEPDENTIYSYQYISTSSGEGYKLYVVLEKTPPFYYEVGSLLGSPIAYAPPGGGGGSGGGGGEFCSNFVLSISSSGAGEYLYDIKQTSDGGYLIPSDGVISAIKIKPDLTLDWAKKINTTALVGGLSAEETEDGNYIIQLNDVDYSILLFKMSPDGSILFQKDLVASAVAFGNTILKTTDGGYILSGVLGNYAVLIKLNSDLSAIQWQKRVSSAPYNYFRAVSTTSDGGYIAAGYTSPGASTPPKNDFFIVKFSSAGNSEWAKRIGGAEEDVVRDIKQTSDGGYIAVGYTKSFGATELKEDAFIVKLASNGATQWYRMIPGDGTDIAFSVIEDSDGNYVVAGRTSSYETNPSWYSDGLLVKINSNGNNIEWAKAIGAKNQTEFFYKIKKTSHGGYIAAGRGPGKGFIVKFDSNWNTCNLQENITPLLVTPTGVSDTFVSPTVANSSFSLQDITATINEVAPAININCSTNCPE